jgi:hypothetical protein
MKPPFNDDYYCRTVEDWEGKAVPHMLKAKGMEWGPIVIVTTVVVGADLVGGDWRRWIGVALAGFLLLKLFLFLEEINENVRFVRHQLRAFRDAVRESRDALSGRADLGRLGALEVLELLNEHWTQP